MDKFLQELGIKDKGTFETPNKYVVELADSNAYSKAYTTLDKSDKVDLDGDMTLVSDKSSSLTYLSDKYDITLLANFVDNVYKIIVTPAEEE